MKLYQSLKNPDETQQRLVAVVLELARRVKALEDRLVEASRMAHEDAPVGR